MAQEIYELDDSEEEVIVVSATRFEDLVGEISYRIIVRVPKNVRRKQNFSFLTGNLIFESVEDLEAYRDEINEALEKLARWKKC